MGDNAKETAVRKSGLVLLFNLFQFLWRIGTCVAAAAPIVWLFDQTGLTTAKAMLDLSLSWEFILGTSVIGVLVATHFSRKRKTNQGNSSYSFADRLVHGIAFSSRDLQLTAADFDQRIMGRRIDGIPDQPPIFITSLPRAGTTVLLNAMNDVPSLATHLYRDMPFITAPLLWSKLSKSFKKNTEERERAHGDGLTVGFDSPEAFEEVFWRMFWPQKYTDETIELWHEDDLNNEAARFFKEHFRKIVALRTDGQGRYISKNNGNIGRLDLLPLMFPGCQIIVPFRDPVEHAASLLRQHLNFLQQQAEDPFVARYMCDIGHFEFGELHRPFAFPGFAPGGRSPQDADYWLAYWIAAYHHIKTCADGALFIASESFGRDGEKLMHQLCNRIGVQHDTVPFSGHFRPIAPRANRAAFSSNLIDEAYGVLDDLKVRDLF
ncbi:sulfotransferase [Roseovarius litorisediminis]|uniref:sulfotransferase n=1 Tax=Roseovarius litorisediminis TaxID=1312363 RepID=UPI00159441FB|nr:sulfotransferase [Roseovarius litorisediminis]